MGRSIVPPPLSASLASYKTAKLPFIQFVNLNVQQAQCVHLLPLAYKFTVKCVLYTRQLSVV
jgi:hypothetical protein